MISYVESKRFFYFSTISICLSKTVIEFNHLLRHFSFEMNVGDSIYITEHRIRQKRENGRRKANEEDSKQSSEMSR